MSDPVIKVKDLVKVFHDFWRRPKVRAVDGVSFEIGEGQIFGLLGPNGSGKSTTIKLMLGLLYPTAGRIEVMGKSPRDVAVKEKIGYLPEESLHYNYLTARETLDFYGRLFDLKGAERRERVEQLLDMVGLVHAADRQVGEFSKGMMRRVGLAQALINDPALVFLDEPTSGLDPTGCRQVKDLMLTLAERGKTIILSSHLLADVEDVCNQIAILYKGNIRARGLVNELLADNDSIRMTIPVLESDKMKKVLDAVKKIIGSAPEVDCPSRNLEEYFLEVVQDAQKMMGEEGTAGSVQLAEFLEKTDA